MVHPLGGQNFTLFVLRHWDQETGRGVKPLIIIKHFHLFDHGWFTGLGGGVFLSFATVGGRWEA